MEEQFIFVYSKYSGNCKKIFEFINSYNPESEKYIENRLKLFCLDNKKIRAIIKKNKNIKINAVPCVLVLIKGILEIYEGSKAFEWIRNFIEKTVPRPMPPPPPPLPQVQPIPKQEVVEEDDEKTDISKIEYENEDRYKNTPQPKRVREDENKYVENEDFFSDEQVDNRKEPKHIVRKAAAERKNEGGIRALADALQKDREETEKSINPAGKKPMDMRGP